MFVFIMLVSVLVSLFMILFPFIDKDFSTNNVRPLLSNKEGEALQIVGATISVVTMIVFLCN